MNAFLLTALLAGAGIGSAQAAAWPLWERYAERFIDGQGRVIDSEADGRTTSEGQAYALFFALVAQDRPRFDKLLAWTENNLAQGALESNLPSWSWGKNKAGSFRVLDRNSASDADLWLTYTLFQAGKLWQEPRLTETATALVNRIAAQEVAEIEGLGPLLLPGPFGFERAKDTYILNASYLPPQLLHALAVEAPDGPWKEMARLLPRLVKGSAPKGFALDWIALDSRGTFHLRPIPAEKPAASYDAIRVYLWAGMLDAQVFCRKELLDSLFGMSSYLNANAFPPAVVDEEGRIRDARGSVGFSAAVIPFLTALNESQPLAAQRRRLEAELDPATGLYGKPARYYDQNLALFATGWSDKQFRFDPQGNLLVTWRQRNL